MFVVTVDGDLDVVDIRKAPWDAVAPAVNSKRVPHWSLSPKLSPIINPKYDMS